MEHWVWFIIIVGVVWLYAKSKKRSVPRVTVTMEMVRPDPEEWAREREVAKKAKQKAIDGLIASFRRPASLTDAFSGMQFALNMFAAGYHVAAPDIERLLADYQGADPKKTELQIRKKINETYKQRGEAVRLVESLALCLLHARFTTENINPAWKISASIKRLLANLNHEKYRSHCIGFLYLFGDTVRSACPDLARLCDVEINNLFSRWHSDNQAKENFEENLSHLSEARSASDKHFTLNALVEYLDKRRRFDPSVRDKLIGLCEEDIRLYKIFLADFACLGGDEKMTFEQALKSKYYICPRLPSFDAIWDVYQEEGNKAELQRLHKLAKEIRYDPYTDDDVLSDSEANDHAEEEIQDPCPVEFIEVVKSGQKGKFAFIDSEGKACSTEDAVQDHFRNLDYRVIRGEVQFWQAMFGLAFWEEIFYGTDAPNGFNDIPSDLFHGDEFYRTRKERIDRKFTFLCSANIHDFITSQLRKHGKTWTRIIFDGGQRDFSYRTVLESADVLDFLKVVSPSVFAKIVYRVAQNPTENRAGTPDYSVWKGSDVSFIEVKGVREKIRESQFTWLAWMHDEGMSVKIVRVKGVASEAESRNKP